MQGGRACNNNSESSHKKIQTAVQFIFLFKMGELNSAINPLNTELNPICHLLA